MSYFYISFFYIKRSKCGNQCKILKTNSRKRAPSFNEEFPTPLDLASAYRISPMICMVFTPLYLRMALRYSRDCHGLFKPKNAAMPCSDFSGAYKLTLSWKRSQKVKIKSFELDWFSDFLQNILLFY